MIYNSIIDTIGDTPLVELPRLSAELKPKGRVLAKLAAERAAKEPPRGEG